MAAQVAHKDVVLHGDGLHMATPLPRRRQNIDSGTDAVTVTR